MILHNHVTRFSKANLIEINENLTSKSKNDSKLDFALYFTTRLYLFAHNWEWHHIDEMFARSHLGADYFKRKLLSTTGEPHSNLLEMYLGLDSEHQELFVGYIISNYL